MKEGEGSGIGDAWTCLQVLRLLKQGERGKDLVEFYEVAFKELRSVLNNSKLIICTPYAAELLADLDSIRNFAIIEDSSSTTEQESWIALSLGARFNIFAAAKGGQPVVKSKVHNEFYNQRKISISNRFGGHPDVPLFNLDGDHQVRGEVELNSEKDTEVRVEDNVVEEEEEEEEEDEKGEADKKDEYGGKFLG